ncbi:cytochrome P450 [Gonapodya prolifera JEL478]|uniref:Cytochrome P450 n=1 Tax=Gonapodya prolifera (strain JEL478) TaxID=1344416 RepID=A0A139AZ85_GONPJ|nr:cytochrome P450 [Gonapodya prolifera JEL478]|eukprot:KXS22027.1 cytochrome P450 [Gonapodya prolifera JEL478]
MPGIFNVTRAAEANLEVVRKHGPLLRFVNVFNPMRRTILIADSALLKEIYVGKDWEKWERGHEVLKRSQIFAGGLILMHNDERWRGARELFGRALTNVALRSYWPIIKGNISTFMEVISEHNKVHGEVDLQEYFTKFTFDTIVRLTFGEDIQTMRGGENLKYIKAWDDLLGSAGIATLLEMFAGQWAASRLDKKIRAAEDVLHSLIRANIERRNKGIDLDRSSIFDIAYESGKVPDFMDEPEMTKQLMTMLFGGHDTTASMLGFLAGHLAENQEWQDRIRMEIIDAMGTDAELNLDKLEGLKCLNAAIKETLRLYPAAVNGAHRMATEDWDYTYTGTDGQTKLIRLKSNDFILNAIFASQRYAPNWSKRHPSAMDEWNPQWFLDDLNGGGNTAFSQAPFGGGARKCLGEKLAYLEGRTIVSELLRNYKIVPVKGWKLKTFQPSMLSTAGVRVHLVPLS